ncbi:hypothetical protein EYC59_03890 [Candidatus Saccharibacteria bacterium]|nr:MAG: hypothetical protein EYC59_03890 [Candidatus Saccharibacteria bacterium]
MGEILGKGSFDDWGRQAGTPVPQDTFRLLPAQSGPPAIERLDDFPTEGSQGAPVGPETARHVGSVLGAFTSPSFDHQERP